MERSGTKWNDKRGKVEAMRVYGSFANSERVEHQAPPPHPSPLKGEGVGGGVGLAAADQRRVAAEWVRRNLPLCSAVAADFRAVFGEVRMSFASENGQTVGKPFDTSQAVTGEALLAHRAVERAERK